jgi:hypothetical protein
MRIEIFHYIEIGSCLIAILLIRQLRRTALFLFVPFLAVTVIYELGSRAGWFNHNNSNHLAASIFTAFEFCFYFYFLHRNFKYSKDKRKVIFSLVLFLLCFAVNILFIQGSGRFNSYTTIVGSFFLVFGACFYFYRLLKLEANIDFFKLPSFWILTGVFMFYLFQFFFWFYFNYMAYTGNYEYVKLFMVISDISNIVLYTCISIGLLCYKSAIPKLLQV